MDIPLNAHVRCLDGVGGESAAVVLNPVTMVVSSIVVKTKEHGHKEVLVPMTFVTDGSVKEIGVKCTLEELGQLDPFMKQVRVKSQGLDKINAQALQDFVFEDPQDKQHELSTRQFRKSYCTNHRGRHKWQSTPSLYMSPVATPAC